jgi:formylglycine-generating enzyme required for sulfatase activity
MINTSDKYPKRVFISYSHQDEAWKERLHTHLKVLEQHNLLDVWEDRKIAAGNDWYLEIEQALNTAQVAILLISANFLSSKFILGQEVPRLLKRRKKQGLRIIPLMIGHCAWEAIDWLCSIQGRPLDNKPLADLSKTKRDKCLKELALEILSWVGLSERTEDNSSEFSQQELQQQRTEYLNYLIQTYKYLDFKGIDSIAEAVKGSSGITLESVYVPLRARLDTPDAETWHRLGGRLYRGAKAVANAEPEKLEQEISRAEQSALTVEQRMQQQPALVILGDPGSGKSTTMKRLALKLAQQDDGSLPILIPLNAYGKRLEAGAISFEEFLPEYFDGKRAQLNKLKLSHLFTNALKQKKAVVLLDGLDEVGLNRGPLVAQIESFVRVWVSEPPVLSQPKPPMEFHYKNEQAERLCEIECERAKRNYERDLQIWQQDCNRMVATSRFVGYRDYPLTDPRWQTVALNDWNREEIDQFFSGFTLACELAWKGGENRGDAQAQARDEQQSLMRVIDNNPGIKRLAGNPLLASLLALIKRQGVTLPDRRVELYKLYMETLLRSWNRARSLDKQPIGPEIDFSPTQRLLAKLALHLRQTNPQGGLIEESAMRNYLLKYFQDDGYTRKEADEQTKGFLLSVHEYSNLLIKKGHGHYGFIHLTFEEYLAGFGLALLREPELQRLFPEYLQQPEQWRETLLLALGVMAVVNTDPEKANAILESLLKTTEANAVLFAGAALNDVRSKVIGNLMTRKIQNRLLSLGQDATQSISIRRRAGLLLGDSGWLPEDLDIVIHIPIGPFLYGKDKVSTIIAHDYWIGQYPVTNAQYRRFIKAGGYQKKAYWTDKGWQQRSVNNWQKPKYWEDSGWANPLSPVVGVSWYEAQAYCAWLQTQLPVLAETMGLVGGIPENYRIRLPNNEEWERAARGGEGREYPWGNDFKTKVVNCGESWGKDVEDRCTTMVGLFPQGVSPEGLLDCAGNVWEWTVSLDADGDPFIRGGSWNYPTDLLRCAFRLRKNPFIRNDYLGFRVILGSPWSFLSSDF